MKIETIFSLLDDRNNKWYVKEVYLNIFLPRAFFDVYLEDEIKKQGFENYGDALVWLIEHTGCNNLKQV